MSEDLRLSVPPDLAKALGDAVAAGEDASLEAALADALTTWAQRHEEPAWLRAGINASLDDPGPDLSSEEVGQHLKASSANAVLRCNAAA